MSQNCSGFPFGLRLPVVHFIHSVDCTSTRVLGSVDGLQREKRKEKRLFATRDKRKREKKGSSTGAPGILLGTMKFRTMDEGVIGSNSRSEAQATPQKRPSACGLGALSQPFPRINFVFCGICVLCQRHRYISTIDICFTSNCTMLRMNAVVVEARV